MECFGTIGTPNMCGLDLVSNPYGFLLRRKPSCSLQMDYRVKDQGAADGVASVRYPSQIVSLRLISESIALHGDNQTPGTSNIMPMHHSRTAIGSKSCTHIGSITFEP